MSNSAAIKKSRDGKLRAIEKLYGLMTLHEPYTTSDPDLADRLRLPKQDIQNARQDLATIGALTVRKVMNHAKKGATGRPTWAAEWTLSTPMTVARARLEAKWRKDDAHTTELLRGPKAGGKAKAFVAGWTNGSTNGATVDHPVLPDVLVAAAGPEPDKPLASLAPARLDEPAAMIAAARQYHSVHIQLEQKVRELEALGVTVDRVALGRAIKAPQDHTLTIVSKVLPYVDGLERQLERAIASNTDLREKLANLPELTQRVSRLHAQNERLVSENTTLRAQAVRA